MVHLGSMACSTGSSSATPPAAAVCSLPSPLRPLRTPVLIKEQQMCHKDKLVWEALTTHGMCHVAPHAN